MTTREIFDKYFSSPEALDSLTKAYYAYHVKHFSLDPGAHNFFSTSKNCSCFWCDRTREQVRWDDLPANCLSRPKLPEIVVTIRTEETKYFELLERSEVEIPQIIKRKFGGELTGETLCYLQNTHGFDPDSVASALDIEIEHLMSDFEKAMEQHKSKSGNFLKKELNHV